MDVVVSDAVLRNFADESVPVGPTGAMGYFQGVSTQMSRTLEPTRPRTYRELQAGLSNSTMTLDYACSMNSNTSALCIATMETFGTGANMNIYMSRGGADRSVPFHSDGHSSFVLQTEGRKRWQIRGSSVRNAVHQHDRGKHGNDVVDVAKLPALIDHVLEPGQFIFLPRGIVHGTSMGSYDETSTSLTLTPHIVNYDLSYDKLMLCALRINDFRVQGKLFNGREMRAIDVASPFLFEPQNAIYREELPVGFLASGENSPVRKAVAKRVKKLFKSLSKQMHVNATPNNSVLIKATNIFLKQGKAFPSEMKGLLENAMKHSSIPIRSESAKFRDAHRSWRQCGFETGPHREPLPPDMYDFFLKQQVLGLKDWGMW